MPTYDYVCETCRHEFELFQQMTDPVRRKCPKCGRRALKRLVGTGAGVLFRGSGFYQTDYRSASYRKAAEAETGTAGTSAAKKDGGADGNAKSDAGSSSASPDTSSAARANDRRKKSPPKE